MNEMILFIDKFARIFLVGVIMVVLSGILMVEFSWIYKQNRQEMMVFGNYQNKDGLYIGNSVSQQDADVGVMSDEAKADDARPLLIERYLAKYKSPLLPYSRLIFELSETYGFDYYWMVAIAQQESNLCKKIPENSHNCWGYGIHKNGTLKFDSYELALKSYAEYLKRAYFDIGLDTPELIMKKYCPHSDGSWARGVRQFIEEIESGSV